MYKPLVRCNTAANWQVFSILELKYKGCQVSTFQTRHTQHKIMWFDIWKSTLKLRLLLGLLEVIRFLWESIFLLCPPPLSIRKLNFYEDISTLSYLFPSSSFIHPTLSKLGRKKKSSLPFIHFKCHCVEPPCLTNTTFFLR